MGRRRTLLSDDDYSNKYLTMEILSSGNITFRMNSNSVTNRTISYRKNGGSWTEINALSTSGSRILNLVNGDKIEFKGNNTTYADSAYYFTGFQSTSNLNIYGNIMSMINGDDFKGTSTLSGSFNFVGFFFGVRVISAKNLILPMETVTETCFRQFFYGVTTLTEAPELPAMNLADDCYRLMFCGCTSLAEAPELPATTMKTRCYYEMFKGCTSLTKAPVLRAITLINTCYAYMFQNCSSLNYIKALFKTKPSNSYTNSWVDGVAASGTFVKNSAATWDVTGIAGIPNGWTVETETQ